MVRRHLLVRGRQRGDPTGSLQRTQQLDNDYAGHQIIELFNNNQNRCVRVNASAPDNPVLGSPGAACDFVAGTSNSEDTRLVSIASCNDNGGSSPFYLETRTLDK
ncbi:MAG: hypothetical protein ACRDRJ_05620, partial [Streptosporangiaceae bacterium]